MVQLHVKKGDESQFLMEISAQSTVEAVIDEILPIYNGRLKVQRICSEIEQLADHGITLPPNMQGLTDEQLDELHLTDEWTQRCAPSGGSRTKKDDIGRRNGIAPNEKMAEVLKKTVKESKDIISKNLVTSNKILKLSRIQEALDILRGAVMIVYPMGLPPHDPIRQEFENLEDLTGTQAALEVIDKPFASLWFAGKEMLFDRKLLDYVGKNEKSKIICKLQKKGQGAPGREPVVTQDEQKAMMAYYYRKQEEMKKLEQDEDNTYLDSQWADTSSLKRKFQGLSNIQWNPGKN